MTERVEEIRRDWGWHNAPQCEEYDESCFQCVVDHLLTALAQAERERDEARAERNARARDVMHLEAEVERLKAQYDNDTGMGRALAASLAAERDRAEADLARVRAALDGTHVHHKAFEPECRYCQHQRTVLEGRG